MVRTSASHKPPAAPSLPSQEAGETRTSRGIQSVEVGGQLLKALAHTGRRMALKDLAREADMTPAKAHPYLVSFGKLGLIEQDPVSGHYGLGPLAMQLGLISLQQVDPVRLAIAALPGLAHKLGCTMSVAVWGGLSPIIIRVEEGPTPVHISMRHGSAASMRHTATGKVFAALRPAEEVAQALAREGHAGALDEPGFAAELQAVRQGGLSRVQDELHLGISGLAAPVFDGFGRLALVIAAIGPTASMQLDEASPQALTLKQASQSISERLGARRLESD
ncbi:IclR family transcriptional regulator [Malikia granosa]|uniref:IclR family transcriptional regulator n=1 Tax=Malikia granosa TaxID=263067 RepID=A0A2S9K0R2_9BURK|nr:IclR family transcriptional regulator [Malikia granosa]PRD64021.1 IclR family transcriptional regulator [Malikia granosa]